MHRSKPTAMALMQITKRKTMKRSKRGVVHRPYLTNLPQDLLAEVLTHVATSSITNLFNAKRACKSMLEASSQRRVLEHAAVLDKFPYIHWRNRRNSSSSTTTFLQECIESGNPEALSCCGMAEYFFGLDAASPSSGIGRLRAAAAKGHVEARYVCGMILSCSGEEAKKEEGLGFLGGLRRSETIRKCRKTAEDIMKHLWWVNGGDGLVERWWLEEEDGGRRGGMSCSCRCVQRGELKCFSRNQDFLWLRREDQVLEIAESRLCDSCFWDSEVPVFRNILRPFVVIRP